MAATFYLSIYDLQLTDGHYPSFHLVTFSIPTQNAPQLAEQRLAALRGGGSVRAVWRRHLSGLCCQILTLDSSRQFQGMIRTTLLMLLLGTALTQIDSYAVNCRIADIDARLCIVCLEGYKLEAGGCAICLNGYSLQANKCLPTSTPAAPLLKTDVLSTVGVPVIAPTSFMPIGQSSFLPPTIQTYVSNTSPMPLSPAPPLTAPAAQVQAGSGDASGWVAAGEAPKYVDGNCKTLAASWCAECYPSFYYNSSEGKCIPVNPLCKTVTNKNQCTACYEGYLLSNGDCSIGSVPASLGESSQKDRNCKNASSWGCNQCYPGFYVEKVQKKCVLTNSRCKTVTPDNACTSCYPGYTLLSDDCKMDSAITTTPTAPTTIPTTTPTTTTSASAGRSSSVPTVGTANSFVLYSGFYFEVTPSGQIVGIFSSQNGSQLNPSSSASPNDPYCSQYAAGVCLTCVAHYYLTAQGCKGYNEQCKTWVGTVCVECGSGYVLSANTCSLPQPAAAGAGESCFFRYVRVGGVCTKVDDQCREWSSVDGKCTSCYQGYSLLGGNCKITT